MKKVKRLSGPGLDTEDVPGVMQGGGKWPERYVFNSLPTGNDNWVILYTFLSPADFFKINFSRKFLQEYH